MTDALTGPERMMQSAMKLMGFKPELLLEKFQQPIEQGLQGIKDVDKRLTNLENNVARILELLQKDMSYDRSDSRKLEFDPDANITAFQRLTG